MRNIFLVEEGGKMRKKLSKKLKSERSEGSSSDRIGHEGTFAFSKVELKDFV